MTKVFFHPAVLTSSSSYKQTEAEAAESPSHKDLPFIEINHPQIETLHIQPESRWIFLHLNATTLVDSAGRDLNVFITPNSAYSHALKQSTDIATVDGSVFDYRKTAIFAVSKSHGSMLLAIPYNLLSMQHDYDSPTEGSKPQAPSPLAGHGFNSWTWHGVVRIGNENESAGMGVVLKNIFDAHNTQLLGICDSQGNDLLCNTGNTYNSAMQNIPK